MLLIVPLTFKAASEFVAKHHRHHRPPTGTKFCIGVVNASNELVGVAMVGRPIARAFDNGLTAEVTRSCTDGTKNANSCLYGAAWRIAKEMGYTRIVTYTQDGETGASLRGAGWTAVKELKARKSWRESSVKGREKRDPVGHGGIARMLWEQRGGLRVERASAVLEAMTA